MTSLAHSPTTGSLVGRIGQLRAAACDDPLSALRQAAPDPQAVIDELGALLGLPLVRMHDIEAWVPLFEELPFAEAAKRRCALLQDASQQRHLVLIDPFDTDLLAWARTRFGALTAHLASEETLDAWLQHAEAGMTALGSMAVGDASTPLALQGVAAESLNLQDIGAQESPAVRFVNSTLYDALKVGASDIHLESDPAGLAVKFRIDGVLTAMRRIDSNELAAQSISRIKVMAQLDIAERRVPQDGRFRVRALGREIDFRVSIMPSIHGEDAVIRVLDKRSLADQVSGLRLDVLGFDESTLLAFRRMTRDPYGLLLVTGPTGSGKTTTLYAAISEINHGHDKIITIEDPVEYQLPGVLQIPVNEKKGLTFARGLRSILRHDPDRIMVGEIRDPETAQIAIQAALTGHLVLSTVHANNVFDVIGRFTHMDVDPYSFVSALTGVLAQRLLRVNCLQCSEPVSLNPQALRESLIDPERAAGRVLRAGRGCGKCRGTGFKGRKAVGELLMLDDALRELIVARAPVRQIKEAARRNGTRFLRDAAVELFLDGHTTLDEVNRVTLVS